MAVGDMRARLRAKFTRRHSTTLTLSSIDGEPQREESRARSLRSLKSCVSHQSPSLLENTVLSEKHEEHAVEEIPELAVTQASSGEDPEIHDSDLRQQEPPKISTKFLDIAVTAKHDSPSTTPDILTAGADTGLIEAAQIENPGAICNDIVANRVDFQSASSTDNKSLRLPANPQRQSLLLQQQTTLIQTLPETDIPPPLRLGVSDCRVDNGLSNISPSMVIRKIWVKRPGASATLVTVNEEDLVDDVREMILKKYANSLGRNFDAPDLTLRICPRDSRQERTLGPEEFICRTLDSNYPGGQTVDDALIIDVPLRRTPRPSPRGGASGGYYHDDLRPGEAGSDYFPPMPVPAIPSPHLPNSVPVSTLANSASSGHHPNVGSHAISVLTTGHVPNLPSPGGSRRHHTRPRAVRQHTSSPTVISNHIQTTTALSNGMHIPARVSRSRTHSSASEKSIAPPAPPLPTPPAQEVTQIQRISTPPPRVSSPRVNSRIKRSKKNSDHPSLPAGLLSGGVPPINVLIVEDNIINLKLLEAFMKRLKVRWQTAMNGKEAVTKWRAGGFHLVLMDIQLPVMNGLEATREIRRLEKLNSIGVFSSSASSSAPECAKEPEGDDKLPDSILFKSPVIIVALTASSLQSDRHEALAAGCNDFLTKVGLDSYHISENVLLTFIFLSAS